MANIVLSGSGPRYEKLLKLVPSSFSKMDLDDILKIQHKVEKAREFLFELENKHLNFNK
jgi:hypothetical protein